MDESHTARLFHNRWRGKSSSATSYDFLNQIQLLESIQDRSLCCGFGDRDSCEENLNVTRPGLDLFGPSIAIQRCSNIQGEAHEVVETHLYYIE